MFTWKKVPTSFAIQQKLWSFSNKRTENKRYMLWITKKIANSAYYLVDNQFFNETNTWIYSLREEHEKSTGLLRYPFNYGFKMEWK